MNNFFDNIRPCYFTRFSLLFRVEYTYSNVPFITTIILGGKYMKNMKKVIQVLAIVLLFGAVSSTTSFAASTDAAKGFYSIEAGKEQYYTINDFKKLDRNGKLAILTGNYYLIANGSVFPISALDLPDAEFLKSRIPEADFERDNNIQIDSSGKITHSDGVVDSDFSVMSIE